MKVTRSSSRRGYTLLTLCALLILSILPLPAVAQVSTQPESSAQVVAQGVDAFSRGNIVWRVIESEAAPGEDAGFGQRHRGFTLATGDPIIVTSLTTGQNTYLSEGQASFTTQGSNERRSSTARRATAYLGIELVAEDADPGSLDSLSVAFTGDPFSSPRGDYNVQLTRSVALPGEEATFSPEDDAPFLLIVTEGAVQVSPEGSSPVELDAGSYVEFTGDIDILSGANQGSTWLIASIGSEVDIPPAPTAAPSDETGTLEIQLELCPDGFDGECEPTTNENVTVPAFHNTEDENWIIPDRADVSDDETTYTYEDLPAGRYTTGPEEDAPDNVNLDGAKWSDDNEGWDFRVRADRTTTLLLQVIPESESDTGSFRVTLYDCPEGTDPASDTSDCAPTSDPWNLWIAPPDAEDMDQFLSLLDYATDLGDGKFVFENVPAQTMELSPDPDGPDGPVLVHIEGDPYKIDIPGMWAVDIEPGETAEATIYRVISSQSTGSVFVTLYDCPDGSDPTESTDGCDISSDPWDVGISYIGQSSRDDWTLGNDAIDMGDGTWWFELLPATTLSLFPAGLEPSGDFDVYAGGDVEFYPENSWVIQVPPAGSAEISLYRVYPESEPAPTEEPTEEPSNGGTGSLVITQYDCPYGTDISVDTSPCELSTAPWEVTVTNVNTGESWSLLSDGSQYDSGTYYFEALPVGTYSISPRPNENWDLYYESTIEISDVNESYVTIYSVDRRAP
jgi:hypothetical protein